MWHCKREPRVQHEWFVLGPCTLPQSPFWGARVLFGIAVFLHQLWVVPPLRETRLKVPAIGNCATLLRTKTASTFAYVAKATGTANIECQGLHNVIVSQRLHSPGSHFYLSLQTFKTVRNFLLVRRTVVYMPDLKMMPSTNATTTYLLADKFLKNGLQ